MMPRKLFQALIVTMIVVVGTGETATATEAKANAPWLAGADLNQPIQAAFAGWPPEELTSRIWWLPWSGASFQRAALFGRPILFVFTVHWNDAARRLETILEDPRVARTVNASWIAIRVNADLRPDLRERYLTGAWPVVAFLLPDGKPMIGRVETPEAWAPITATAIRPEDLVFLLQEGAVYWDGWREELTRAGAKWAERERVWEPRRGDPNDDAVASIEHWLLANADAADGGFGPAPKFPVSGVQELADLRGGFGPSELGQQAQLTLARIIDGPLFDAVDGGVARMARLPGFAGVEPEKLLETQSILIEELTAALRGGRSPEFRDRLAKTAEFVVRRLGRPEGGFFLAEFADPGPNAARRRDPLVLTGESARAAAAVARAGLLLGDANLTTAGRKAFDDAIAVSWRPGQGVGHSIEPQADGRMYLETQAEVALAAIGIYETTGEPRYLDLARDVAETTWLNLREPGEGALRDHLAEPGEVGLLANARRPLRSNVRLARAWIRLEHLGVVPTGRERAQAILGTWAGGLTGFGVHGIEAGLAIAEVLAEPTRVRIEGPADDPQAQTLRRAVIGAGAPFLVVRTGDPALVPAAVIENSRKPKRLTTPDAVERALNSRATSER